MSAEHVAEPNRVDEWLIAWSQGDQRALDRVVAGVYRDLLRLAASFLANERPDPLLQPAVLVHEAFLRLVGQRQARWRNRAQFLAVAARMMRRVLLDEVRKRCAEKRGSGLRAVPLDEACHVTADDSVHDLYDAIADLKRVAPRQGAVVKLRYFIGMTIDETAQTLGVSPATVKIDWQMARAWLLQKL